MQLKHIEIMKELDFKIVSFEQCFGVKPNIVKLSPDYANTIACNSVMEISRNEKFTICGIEIEIEMDKQNYMKVGYIE